MSSYSCRIFVLAAVLRLGSLPISGQDIKVVAVEALTMNTEFVSGTEMVLRRLGEGAAGQRRRTTAADGVAIFAFPGSGEYKIQAAAGKPYLPVSVGPIRLAQAGEVAGPIYLAMNVGPISESLINFAKKPPSDRYIHVEVLTRASGEFVALPRARVALRWQEDGSDRQTSRRTRRKGIVRFKVAGDHSYELLITRANFVNHAVGPIILEKGQHFVDPIKVVMTVEPSLPSAGSHR